MATPFPFATGQVLTAAQMNAITELVINDKTASYTLVAGDAGEYVVMNSSSATTITVNNSIFSASQVVYIVNKGTASTVITAGAGVTISTSGSLTVPANGSGRLLALSASAFIYEAGGITASSGALVFITGASYSASSSVALNGIFSSTYANYRIVHRYVTASSGADTVNRLRVGTTDTTTATYQRARVGGNSSGAFGNANSSQTSWAVSSGNDTTANTVLDIWDITGPQLAERTTAMLQQQTFDGTNISVTVYAFSQTGTTQFDGMSLAPGTSTMTGRYWVYGYSNS